MECINENHKNNKSNENVMLSDFTDKIAIVDIEDSVPTQCNGKMPNPEIPLAITNLKSCEIPFKDFFNNYLLKNIPCVIKNVAMKWECTQKWIKNNEINYDYFVESYGFLDVPVADCNSIEFNSQCKSTMKLYEYVNYFRNRMDSQLFYLKDWHLKRIRPQDAFYEIPQYFVLDWLNEYATDNNEDDFMFVYFGPKGSWTPLHEDVYRSYSWSVNVIGRKKWILFPPGEEMKFKSPLGQLPVLFNAKLHQDIVHFEVIQEKGDAIFVPSGWHHQVVNDIDTISINHNWINACNITIVWNALQESLLKIEIEIEEFKNTPEFPSQCQLILKSLFGMDIKSFVKLICYIAKKRLAQLQERGGIGLGKYYLGINIIKFDLISIMKVMDLVSLHPIFMNKDIFPMKDDFIQLKTLIQSSNIDN